MPGAAPPSSSKITDTEHPLLSPGVLFTVDALRLPFGPGLLDVIWETRTAHAKGSDY